MNCFFPTHRTGLENEDKIKYLAVLETFHPEVTKHVDMVQSFLKACVQISFGPS